jgi:hypothetical protein
MNIPHLSPSIATYTNPGCINPADQAAIPVRNAPAAPSLPCSLTITSDGDPQRLDIRPVPKAIVTAQGPTVNVSAGSASQAKAIKATKAVSTGHGLPAEAFPGSANAAMHMLPAKATCTMPAVSVDAGSGKPGGLPINVFIR